MATLKGGNKLVEKLEAFSRSIRTANRVRIGFLSNATYPNGTPVALIALIQDSGAPSRGIPPRPFFRNMIAKKKGEWGKATAALFKANDGDSRKTLEQMGQGISGQLKQSIVDTNEPPLAASTIARKGFAKPLVDTGHMLQSVDYEVVSPT